MKKKIPNFQNQIYLFGKNLLSELFWGRGWGGEVEITWWNCSRLQYFKVGYTLIISRILTCSCTILWSISWDCEPITIHFSQYHWFCSSLILQETWRETCRIVLFDVSWKYRSPGKNGEMRDEKNDWRDGLRNAIYTLLVSLISPTFFHVLVNLTISV